MNKLPRHFALVLILLSSLVVMPVRVNAGQAVIKGGTPESSSYSGDSFGHENHFNRFFSQKIQVRVNEIASNIISNPPAVNTPGGSIFTILRGESSANTAKDELRTTLVGLGASSRSSQELIESISGLLATNNVNIYQLSAAINAWNKVVNQLNTANLQQLANNPEIAKLVNDLKQLRSALKK